MSMVSNLLSMVDGVVSAPGASMGSCLINSGCEMTMEGVGFHLWFVSQRSLLCPQHVSVRASACSVALSQRSLPTPQDQSNRIDSCISSARGKPLPEVLLHLLWGLKGLGEIPLL